MPAVRGDLPCPPDQGGETRPLANSCNRGKACTHSNAGQGGVLAWLHGCTLALSCVLALSQA